MPFGSLSPEQRIRVMLLLENAAQYVGRMNEAAAATARLAASEKVLQRETKAANAQTFIQRQGLYTLRRYTFFLTSALTFAAAGVVKLGFEYNNAMQTARVAMGPVFKNQQALNRELSQLFILAAKSPFLFKDTTVAFRNMYAAFHPLGFSVQFTNQTIDTLINSLAYAGRTTPAALNRVSVQLQHMAFVGRPAGQIILNLARDGLPIYAALHKQLHLNDLQIQNIARSGITAKQIIVALNNYVRTTPGYMGAALRQANRTLLGSWQQFKDLLSQAAGGSIGGTSGGLFGGLHKILYGVNKQLAAQMSANKPVTMTQLVSAFDRQLSPSTHLIINLFILLNTVLHTVFIEFGLIAKTISILLYPLDKLASLFGANRLSAHLLGIVLGTFITLATIARLRILALAEAEAIAKLSTLEFGKAVVFTQGVMRVFKLLMAGELISTIRTWAFETQVAAIWNTRLGKVMNETFVGGMGRKIVRGIFTMTAAIGTASAATWTWVTANIALIATFGVYLAIGAILVVLYIKWKAFHKAVDDLWRDIIYFSPIIAISLTDAFGPLGVVITSLLLIIRYWKQIKQLTNNFRLSPTGDLGGSKPAPSPPKGSHYHGWSWSGFFHSLIHPGLAEGGRVVSPGRVLVGENGPELLNLPRAASVVPLNNDHLAGSIVVHVYPQDMYIDGRKVGEAVATAYTDTQARNTGS